MKYDIGIWKTYIPDEAKTARAKKVRFISMNLDNEMSSSECQGSRGEVYSVSLEQCSCVDFSKNKRLIPCKHMIALAMRCKLLNENGLTFEQDNARITYELAMKVAIASAFYHIFHKPIVSDKVYNALKYELWDWCGWVEEKDVRDLDKSIDQSEHEWLNMPLSVFQERILRLVEADQRSEDY